VLELVSALPYFQQLKKFLRLGFAPQILLGGKIIFSTTAGFPLQILHHPRKNSVFEGGGGFAQQINVFRHARNFTLIHERKPWERDYEFAATTPAAVKWPTALLSCGLGGCAVKLIALPSPSLADPLKN
jgi:hypothetical protein